MEQSGSIIKSKSFLFAIRMVKLYKYLVETKKEFILSKQLLRSGTSIGANIREAYNDESDADFVHKLVTLVEELSVLSNKAYFDETSRIFYGFP